MNKMDDNELQALFEAKRTTEANRRRQERLAETIARLAAAEAGAEPKRHTRRLWPAWTGAAAAAVAVLLVATPLLRQQGDEPPILAQAPAVQPVEPLPQEVPTAADRTRDDVATGTPRSMKVPRGYSHHTPQAEELPTDEPAQSGTEAEVQPDEARPQPVAVEEEAVPATPVRRRSSTLLACTEGCTPPQGQSDTPPRAIQIIFGEGAVDQSLAYASPLNIPLKDIPTPNRQ